MLLASNWPPSVTASNSNLQAEADGDADDDLLHGDDHAGGGEQGDVRWASESSGAMIMATAPASTIRIRAGTNCAPNAGADHEAGADAHERPEQLREPSLELSCGEWRS